jgi:hypothetical protein
MSQNSEKIQLSGVALAELGKITRKEYGQRLSDQEIKEVGIRLLNLFSVLANGPAEPKPVAPVLTEQESKVLTFSKMKFIIGTARGRYETSRGHWDCSLPGQDRASSSRSYGLNVNR